MSDSLVIKNHLSIITTIITYESTSVELHTGNGSDKQGGNK